MGAIFNSISSFRGVGLISSSVSTTDATPTVVPDLYTVPSDTIVRFKARVLAVQTGGIAGAVGDTSTIIVEGTIRNLAGTTTIIDVNSTEKNSVSDNASTWDADVLANDTTDTLEVQVTGELNKTIKWQIEVELLPTTI